MWVKRWRRFDSCLSNEETTRRQRKRWQRHSNQRATESTTPLSCKLKNRIRMMSRLRMGRSLSWSRRRRTPNSTRILMSSLCWLDFWRQLLIHRLLSVRGNGDRLRWMQRWRWLWRWHPLQRHVVRWKCREQGHMARDCSKLRTSQQPGGAVNTVVVQEEAALSRWEQCNSNGYLWISTEVASGMETIEEHL
jgi:hypothetical protein